MAEYHVGHCVAKMKGRADDYTNDEMLMGRITLIGERKKDCEQEI